MRSILPILCLILPASALRLHPGASSVWRQQNLTTLAETPVRLTVLDSGISDSLPADSGRAWRILLETSSTAPETLELFQFGDGELRWLRYSANFPVELESPRAASRSLLRGGIHWGLPKAGALIAQHYVPRTDLRVGCDIDSSGNRTSAHCSGRMLMPNDRVFDLGNVSIQGIWTDSVGPIWFSDRGYIDWSLDSVDGSSSGWSNPRMDSVRAVLRGLSVRNRSIRHPAVGDSFAWKHMQFNTTSQGSVVNRISRVLLAIGAAPDDSAGWIRRRLDFVEIPDSGTSTSWSSWHRWDTLGKAVVTGESYEVLVNLWTVGRFDALSDTACTRTIWEKGSGTATYRHDGLLLGSSSSDWGCTSAMGVSCALSMGSFWSLLSAPGLLPNALPRRSPSSPKRLDHTLLHALLATDPDATVRWTTLSGRSGQQNLSDFMKSPQRFGAQWLRVRTSKGIVKEGLVLQTR